MRASVLGKDARNSSGAPLPLLARCKLQLLDVVNAWPVAPPEDFRDQRPGSERPGSEASRHVWAAAIREAGDPAALSTLLLKFAKLLPPHAFKKGFRRWWLADGGQADREAEAQAAQPQTRGEKKDKEEAKPVKESKELPPPQADTVHQVLLRLHLLDGGLAYGG